MFLKALDKAWFRLREHINPPSYDAAYQQGFQDAVMVCASRYKYEMQENTMHDWKSKEMQLGYMFGQRVVENATEKLKRQLAR